MLRYCDDATREGGKQVGTSACNITSSMICPRHDSHSTQLKRSDATRKGIFSRECCLESCGSSEDSTLQLGSLHNVFG